MSQTNQEIGLDTTLHGGVPIKKLIPYKEKGQPYKEKEPLSNKYTLKSVKLEHERNIQLV